MTVIFSGNVISQTRIVCPNDRTGIQFPHYNIPRNICKGDIQILNFFDSPSKTGRKTPNAISLGLERKQKGTQRNRTVPEIKRKNKYERFMFCQIDNHECPCPLFLWMMVLDIYKTKYLECVKQIHVHEEPFLPFLWRNTVSTEGGRGNAFPHKEP